MHINMEWVSCRPRSFYVVQPGTKPEAARSMTIHAESAGFAPEEFGAGAGNLGPARGMQGRPGGGGGEEVSAD